MKVYPLQETILYIPFYRGSNSHFNMGNSSGRPYSPKYNFKNTDEVECATVDKQGNQEEGWFFVEINNPPHDQDSIDYDSDYYYSEDEEDIELYKEICQILSDEGDNTSDPEWVCVCKNQD